MNPENEAPISILRSYLWLNLVLIVLLALPTNVGMVLFLPLLYLIYGGIQASLTLRGLRWLKEGKRLPWPFRRPVDVYAAVAIQSLYTAGLILAILYVYADFSFAYLNYHMVTTPEFFWLGYAKLANLSYLVSVVLWVMGRLACKSKA